MSPSGYQSDLSEYGGATPSECHSTTPSLRKSIRYAVQDEVNAVRASRSRRGASKNHRRRSGGNHARSSRSKEFEQRLGPTWGHFTATSAFGLGLALTAASTLASESPRWTAGSTLGVLMAGTAAGSVWGRMAGWESALDLRTADRCRAQKEMERSRGWR